MATKRRPRLLGIGLEAVGLEPDDVLAGRLPGWLHTVGEIWLRLIENLPPEVLHPGR